MDYFISYLKFISLSSFFKLFKLSAQKRQLKVKYICKITWYSITTLAYFV